MTPMAIQLTDETSVWPIRQMLPAGTPLVVSLDPLRLEVGRDLVPIEAGDWLIRDEAGRLMRGTAVAGGPADELTALRRVHSAAAALEAEVLSASGRMTDAHRDLAQALASAATYLPATPPTA